MADMFSIVAPVDATPGTCGYCGPPGQRSAASTNHYVACLMARQLSCDGYQKMIDRGWRRSGEYCYKPDLKRSCCPQYTIRLDALQFKPSKSQRKLVNRFNRWILYGDDHEDKRPKIKTSDTRDEFSLRSALHEGEFASCSQHGVQPAHRFEVTLEPSSYTQEKFELFKKYQADIHHEEEKKSSSFQRFLVDSPLTPEQMPYSPDSNVPDHLPRKYGSYHQLYRIDGKLVAMGVIDILPSCVSSVYFMYDKHWERFSLGKLSALREACLVQEIHSAGVPGLSFLYMGFYIYSCPKMRYKGEYSPSYLADPENFSWHRLEKCTAILGKNRYACFSHPERSVQGDFDAPPEEPQVTPAMLDTPYIVEVKRGVKIIVAPVKTNADYREFPFIKKIIDATMEALGEGFLKDAILDFSYV